MPPTPILYPNATPGSDSIVGSDSINGSFDQWFFQTGRGIGTKVIGEGRSTDAICVTKDASDGVSDIYEGF